MGALREWSEKAVKNSVSVSNSAVFLAKTDDYIGQLEHMGSRNGIGNLECFSLHYVIDAIGRQRDICE